MSGNLTDTNWPYIGGTYIQILTSEITSMIDLWDNEGADSTEKQFRKDPHSYLLNECWEDEVILKPEVIEQQKLEYIEKKREEEYIKQKLEQQRIEDESADDEWKQKFLSGLKKDLINKGVE